MKRERKYVLYLGCVVLLMILRTQPCRSDDSTVPPFSIGEVIRYTIHAGGIKVGIQTVKLASMEVLDGRSVYRIRGKMKTTGILNLFFQISEEWEVLVDSSTFSPVRIERNITDRGSHSSYVYCIHQDVGEVVVIDRTRGKEKVLHTRNLVFDQFSLCYFYRKNPGYFKGNAVFDFLKKDSLETIVLREEGMVQVNIPKLSGSDKTSSHMFIEDGGGRHRDIHRCRGILCSLENRLQSTDFRQKKQNRNFTFYQRLRSLQRCAERSGAVPRAPEQKSHGGHVTLPSASA